MKQLKNTSLQPFKSWSHFIVLCLLVLLFFSPIFYVNSYIKADKTDFRAHIVFARQLTNGFADVPAFILAHFGWQFLLVLINKITRLSFETASFMAVLLC